MTLYGMTSSLRDWATTIRKWKDFRQKTGTWPVFSIAASSLHTMGYIVGIVFLIWYSEKHRWSNNHFALILVVVLIPYVFVWAWVQNKNYIGELRRAKSQRGINFDFGHAHSPSHHKNESETAIVRKGRGGSWAQLVAASSQIDNGIFITFLVFIAATIIAKTLFWILGW
jgi:hypothetical protein